MMSGSPAVAAVYEAVNELQSSAIPLLASPQGGVAASSIRYCEATEAAAAGVVFLLVFDRKTTPASRSAEASRYFVTRSATPPCGDARRGICSIPICSHLHRPPTMLCREIVGGHRPPLQWANDIRLQAVREQIPEADVAVIGGGNAALCAALVARESGASVVVLECAPVEYRGGNSRHTRNMRCMHQAPTDVLTDAYTPEEYFDDLSRVTGGDTTEELAKLIIQESLPTSRWM